MNARHVGGLVALVLVPAFLMLDLGGEGRAQAAWPEADPRTLVEATPVEIAILPEPEAPPALEERLSPQEPAMRQVVEASTAAVQLDRSALQLAGTVVLVEADGSELTNVDGSFHLLVWGGGSRRKHDVTVEEGRWSLELLPTADGYRSLDRDYDQSVEHARLEPRRPLIDVDGGAVVLEDNEPSYNWGSTEVVLRVRRVPAFTLRIEDALTGAPLDGVSVLYGRYAEFHEPQHPGLGRDHEALVENASSPIAIQPDRELLRRPRFGSLLVGCPGYSWAPVALDLRGGGERRVRLHPGGELRVELLGVEDRGGSYLRLRRGEQDRPFVEVGADRKTSIELTDLLPGTYDVRVEVGERWGASALLGETPVEVIAGQRSSVRLELTSPPEFERAELAGILVVPPAWGSEDLTLWAHLLGEPRNGGRGKHRVDNLRRREGSEDTYTWSIENIQVGQYMLHLEPLGYSTVVELPPHGNQGVEMIVPEPTLLRVCPVDAATGEPVDVGTVFWYCELPADVAPSRGHERATRGPGDTCLEFRVPRARIGLWLMHEEYGSHIESVEPRAEVSEVVLRLTEASVVSIQLRDGELAIPWPIGEWELDELAGPGIAELNTQRDGVFEVALSEPGLYSFRPPAIAGYEEPEVQEFEIVAGEVTTVIVDLVAIP